MTLAPRPASPGTNVPSRNRSAPLELCYAPVYRVAYARSASRSRAVQPVEPRRPPRIASASARRGAGDPASGAVAPVRSVAAYQAGRRPVRTKPRCALRRHQEVERRSPALWRRGRREAERDPQVEGVDSRSVWARGCRRPAAVREAAWRAAAISTDVGRVGARRRAASAAGRVAVEAPPCRPWPRRRCDLVRRRTRCATTWRTVQAGRTASAPPLLGVSVSTGRRGRGARRRGLALRCPRGQSGRPVRLARRA